MPDITMCVNDACPMADKCWRFGAPPNTPHQAYAKFEPVWNENEDYCTCAKFIDYPDLYIPEHLKTPDAPE